MKRYLPWLLRLLGPALLIYVLFFTGLQWSELGASLASANLWLVLLSLLLMAPFIWIKAWRWTQLLHELHIELPLNTAAGIYAVGIFLGGTTPGQAGDFAKGFYLRDRGAALAPAMLSVVLDRLCDLLVMAVLAALSVFTFSSLLPNQALQTALVFVTGGGLLLATWMLLARGPREWLLGRVLPPLLPDRLRA
ncbi:MAG: flippase-like domain-containing protein, partial [Chloroflexales bacterium]|nr:flippase-like domain-containing protein [Chloroflexales bacterium]